MGVRNSGGMTPLMARAAIGTDVEMVAALRKAGADVNERSETGLTALMYAALYNANAKVLSALIAAVSVNSGSL